MSVFTLLGSLAELELLVIILDVRCCVNFGPLILTHRDTDTNHFNVGALMERGIRLVGCGQAPVQKCKEPYHKLTKRKSP